MKPTMLKSHAKLIFKFALIGVFSALLAGCGGQDTTNPKSYDTYGPIITLNSAGADAIVETNSGSLLIPRENICYEISDVCEDATIHYSDFIHYTALEDDIEVFKSLEGMIIGYSEDHSHGNDYTDPSAIARDVYDGHVDVATELGGPETVIQTRFKLSLSDRQLVYTHLHTPQKTNPATQQHLNELLMWLTRMLLLSH